MDDDLFHAMVQPTLASLFAVNDRGVRVMLLQNIPSYGKRLEDKVINEQVGWKFPLGRRGRSSFFVYLKVISLLRVQETGCFP